MSRPQNLAQFLTAQARGGRPMPAAPAGMPRPANPRPLASTLGAHEAPQRVSFPLGSLYNHVLSPDIVPFTHQGSKLPNENLYAPTLSPQSAYTFDVAIYEVPLHMVLLVLGYELSATRLGGVDAYDTQPLEPGRMRQSWLWDLNVTGSRSTRQTTFEIVPTPIVQRGAGNGVLQAVVANGFASSPAATAQQAGGAALASLPFDGREYGPDRAPFSLRVDQGQTVAVRCTAIRPLSVPLASIDARIDGFLFPVTLLDAYADLVQL